MGEIGVIRTCMTVGLSVITGKVSEYLNGVLFGDLVHKKLPKESTS